MKPLSIGYLMQITLLIMALAIVGLEGQMVQPTPTTPVIVARSVGPASPTVGPRFVKRDNVDDTLSRYQEWAQACGGNMQLQQVPSSAPASVRALWRTVTETVYCGKGGMVTVTKTITAVATATVVVDGSQKHERCNDQCWSDYLWHTYGNGITVAQGFTGITCILLGMYLMLFGYRFFRPTLAIVGFVFFATMTWIGLANNEPASGYPHFEIVYICVSVGLGLLGAGLFMFFYPLALYFIGALGGFFFSVFIMSWQEQLVIHIKVARICFIIGMGVLFAILVYLLESYVVIFSTSFVGAFLFILGLDLFIHTGFVNAWLLIFDGNPNRMYVYIMNRPVYVMLAFVIVLALLFTAWQYVWNIIINKRYFGINAVKEKPEA